MIFASAVDFCYLN